MGTTFRLGDLFPGAFASAEAARTVTGVTADSRAVKAGMVFVALAGAKADGARFVDDAVAKGAAAVVMATGAERPAARALPVRDLPGFDLPVAQVTDPRRALALAAACIHSGQPETIVAVTGTSGKSSVADFVRQIFGALGRTSASLGTVGIVTSKGATYGSLTTPDPVTLHATLDRLASGGITHLAMEASSHGLDQRRLDGVRLTAGAFINLGHDHLDYHPTVEDYLVAKLRLWELLPDGAPVVVNLDGARGADATQAARALGHPVLGVGMAGDALKLLSVHREGFGQRLTIAVSGQSIEVLLPLAGDFMAGNALVAAGLCIAAGEDSVAAVRAIAGLRGVPGRLERVGVSHGGLAIVDYAHKPDALSAVLTAMRPFATGKLICVVGCGGDRDRAKRPLMGAIASAKADVVIVTDDNPRSEVPAAIRAEVMAAAPGATEIGDRSDAIRAGVKMLGQGDVLVVAGKGHETGQIVGDRVLPFSDHEAVLAAIAEFA